MARFSPVDLSHVPVRRTGNPFLSVGLARSTMGQRCALHRQDLRVGVAGRTIRPVRRSWPDPESGVILTTNK